ncbi:TolB family protein [Dactylosporangium sp. CS-033363]|uniref:TolB family protein n=1 Tax=Dactylosporangium sp. CS-033363 TaxID=3239935 RepID=UPI003D91BEDD
MNGKTITKALTIAGLTGTAGLTALLGAAPAHATTTESVAYVRAGVIYRSAGATETRLTEDALNARPRFSPDGTELAYLHDGKVWVMDADGANKHQVSDRPAGGPAWSPDGRSIAFAALSCTGGPGVFRVPAAGGTTEALFPASCRDQELPQVAAAESVSSPAATLVDRLRTDDAVAWSPDGTQIAFRGGECESIADNCLSIGTVTTGRERAIDVYGGGGNGTSGFGVVPAWRADGKKVAWTTYAADGTAVAVTEANSDGSGRHAVGKADDRELVYTGTSTAVLTGALNGHSWVTAVDLSTGKRTPLHQGSQPTVAP